MKKISLSLLVVLMLFSIGCGESENPGYGDNNTVTINKVISADEAKKMMDESSVIIVDVRTLEEFNDGHIENAINLPVDAIEETALEVFPDQEATYLLYCRSGNRSAQAANIMADLGYQTIYDFGGINDWTYDVVK